MRRVKGRILTATKATIEGLEGDLAARGTRIEDRQDRIDRLEARVANRDDRIAGLEDENEQLRDENERLRERNEELAGRLDAVETHLGMDSATGQPASADD